MTEVQSNASVGRPLPVPTLEELPPLLARTPLAVIDEALTFLRINPGLFFGLSAIIVIPLQLILLVLPGSSLRGNRPDRTIDIIIGSLDQPGAIANGLGTLVFASISLFAVASVYGQLTAAWYSQRSVSPSDLLVAAFKRVPFILGAWTLTHVIIILLGSFTFGILGLFAGVLFAVVAPVMGAEELGAIGAIKRSRDLATSKLGQTLIVYVLVAGAGQIIGASIRFAPVLILNQLNVPLFITGEVFEVIATVVVVSFTAATSVVLYLDLRVRREGIDLYLAIDKAFGLGGRGG